MTWIKSILSFVREGMSDVNSGRRSDDVFVPENRSVEKTKITLAQMIAGHQILKMLM